MFGAPSKKMTFAGIAVSTMFFSPVAEGQTDKLFACLELKNDTERLSCFDNQVQELKDSKSAGTIAIIDQAELQKIERESFGLPQFDFAKLFRPSKQENDEIETAKPEKLHEIEAAIDKATISKLTGKLILELANGQVWEQTDSARIGLSVAKNAKNARIKSAALGSYFVEIDGRTNFRAKRSK